MGLSDIPNSVRRSIQNTLVPLCTHEAEEAVGYMGWELQEIRNLDTVVESHSVYFPAPAGLHILHMDPAVSSARMRKDFVEPDSLRSGSLHIDYWEQCVVFAASILRRCASRYPWFSFTASAKGL